MSTLRVMTNELRDGDHGIWVVTTASATYRVDLQDRTLCRHPKLYTSASADPPTALRRDTDSLVLWHLAMCAVGKPMIALVQVRDDAVPTMRTTTPVQAITRVGGEDSPLDLPDWLPVQPGTLDRRVLLQDQVWVMASGQVLRINDEVTPEHARNILAMLQRAAVVLHLDAILDAVIDEAEAVLTGTLTAERLAQELAGGENLATVSASEWLETLPLVRTLRRRALLGRSPTDHG